MSQNKNKKITRREFLKGGALVFGSAMFTRFADRSSALFDFSQTTVKRIYIAPDDHTDYFWSAGESAYQQAFLGMLDYYLDLADATQGNISAHQSRWNCDGSFWLWAYEKNKPVAEYQRLINRIRDGHVSVPLNALVSSLGGAPAEAVIRGMYYPGKIERREGLRFTLATSIENQSMPYGLVSLWAGSGAKYSWKGICGCDTVISAPGDREHEIYWWQAQDGGKVLMKWNSMPQGNQSMGGYAEARDPSAVVEYVDTNAAFIAKYPYSVIGCFGKGWDDLETMTDEFVTTAQAKTNANRQVIVSNEQDFFIDFETNFGGAIPTAGASFGNEWDLYCASLAETSASIKRSVEKLRGAEALATLVTLQDLSFMTGREEARDLAWMNLGLYWEHNFGMVGSPSGLVTERKDWQKRLDTEIKSYVDTLASDAITSLAGMIQRSGADLRFFVFNPLSWARTDYADFAMNNGGPIHVIDLTTGLETPSQFVTVNGQSYLRILAESVPSVGYKVFEIKSGAGQSFSDAATVVGSVIENSFYQVTVNNRGAITSWVDKMRSNRQFARLINTRYINDLGGSDTGTGYQVENVGPVSVTLLVTSSSALSHTSRITLIRNSNRVVIQNDINQNFTNAPTWGFGFELNNPNTWHEEVGAVIRAKLTTQGGHYSPRPQNSRYDWLTLNHFVDVNDGTVGVTLSNADCYFMKLGNSTISSLDTTTPQISVLAGGKVVNGSNGLPNQGSATHFLQRFALQTHDAYNAADSIKFALEHQNPFMVGGVAGGTAYPETNYSLVSINNPNVLLWALKPADDGLSAGYVTRLWNLSQSQQAFSLALAGSKIIEAKTVTHIETPIGNAPTLNGELTGILSPHQMKTFSFLRKNSLTPIPGVQPTFPPFWKSQVIAPSIVISQNGSDNGSLPSLGLLQQNGLDDNPATYVTFQTMGSSYLGYQSFYLLNEILPARVSSMLLQINFKDTPPATRWTWSIYSWNTGQWVKLGDKISNGNQWQMALFGIRNTWLYISPGREIRIQLRSNYPNGELKVDYEAIHVTYRTITPETPQVAPTVPPNRPGIASAGTQTPTPAPQP